MGEFTTIQITKSLKNKLDYMKGENRVKYNDVIEKLVDATGGAIIDDVITVEREATAFTLKYWSGDVHKVKDVTYAELAKSDVGYLFFIDVEPVGDEWVNSTAKVMAKEGDDVILLVKEVAYSFGRYTSVKSVVHVKLF